jgi:DNA-binding protein WhiA
MSFASDTKSETARNIATKRCCKLAETAGFIRVAGSITLSGRGKMGILITTAHPAVARHFKTLIAEVFGVSPSLMVGEAEFHRNRHVYRLIVSAEKGAERMLKAAGILVQENGAKSIHEGIDERLIRGKCCRKAYLRGLFLGAGIISNPDRAYHLEIVTDREALSHAIRRLFNSFTDIHAKVAKRRGNYVVYLKDAEQIKDILGIIGAHTQLFKYEDVRVMKEVRNRTNRLNNCDNANMDRALRSADRQLQAIRAIQSSVGLDALEDSLLNTALARLDHPEASLAELGEVLNPPLKKAGVAYRIGKILAFAEGLDGPF